MSGGKRAHFCARARAPVAVVARFWLGGRQRHRIVHHVFLRACKTYTRRTQALRTAPDRSSAQCSSAPSRCGMRRSAGSDGTSLLGHRLHLQVRILHPRLHMRSKRGCRPCPACENAGNVAERRYTVPTVIHTGTHACTRAAARAHTQALTDEFARARATERCGREHRQCAHGPIPK